MAAFIHADITGRRPTVACSRMLDANDISPANAIKRFRTANSPWMVAVNMVSEGIDIPRLRAVVHLTNRLTLLSFRQIVGRVVRSDPRNEDDCGRVYVPADERLLRMAEQVTDTPHLLPPPLRIEVDAMPRGPVPIEGEGERETGTFEVLSTVGSQGAVFSTDGRRVDRELVDLARMFIAAQGLDNTDAESLAMASLDFTDPAGGTARAPECAVTSRGTQPMIILVGGAFTPDGGSPLDSRQQLAGDDGSEAMRKSLGGSWFWWASVASVVIPILESAGPNAYALVIGERSVHELKPDGSTARESLRRLLPGGTGNVAFVPRARTEEGAMGVDADSVARYELSPGQSVRWRFIDGSDPDLERFSAEACPAVIVDTSAAIYTDQPAMQREKRQRLDRRFAADNPPILVLPHTAATEAVIDAFLKWRISGRPEVRIADRPQSEQAWIDTPPDPMDFTQMVPVQADLRVSGLVREGAWVRPDNLEAARQLLQARFDLRIGIWDLVDNAILRESLLVDAPIAPTPAEQVPVPRGAAVRANAAAEKKIAQQERLREIYGVSDPLASLGG